MIVVFLWARRSSSHWTSSSVLVCNMHHMIRIKIICWSNVVLFCFFFHSILISFSSLLRSRVSGSTSQQLREAGETRFGAGTGQSGGWWWQFALKRAKWDAAVHHQLMTTTTAPRRRMTMMIAYIIIINLYTYICWAQRSRSGRCRSRNQTLPWVWFGCWFVSGLPLKTGFVFIFFLCYCLRSLILAPATLSDLHLILILRLLASPVGRSFCPVLRLVSDDEEDEAGWLGSQALQFTATDSQQNRLEDWSWNAITINKCRKDTVKRSGEESEILINKSH